MVDLLFADGDPTTRSKQGSLVAHTALTAVATVHI